MRINCDEKKFKDIDKNFKSIETLYGVGYRYTE